MTGPRNVSIAPDREQMARAAAWYAHRGWCVFPLAPGSKNRPMVKDWEHHATTNPHDVERWWARGPFNIGIACGPSNLVVVDLDRPLGDDDQPPAPWAGQAGVRDGSDVLAALAETAGAPFPHATHTVGTGSGGIHLYFAPPSGGPELRNTSGRLGWKIDTRANGGYVVAAGSVVDGRRYRTLNTTPPAPLPGWITTALAQPRRPAPQPATGEGPDAYAHAALRGELDNVLAARPGTRNHTLNTAAYALGQLVAAGRLDAGQVTAALTVAAGHIGLDEGETARTIASGLTAGAHHPRRTA